MQTIMIDGSRYTTPREMHLALKRMLSLPEYYGLNADALNPGTGDVASAVAIAARVIRDNGGEVKEL